MQPVEQLTQDGEVGGHGLVPVLGVSITGVYRCMIVVQLSVVLNYLYFVNGTMRKRVLLL